MLAAVDGVLAHKLQQGRDSISGTRVAPNHECEVPSLCDSDPKAAAAPPAAATVVTTLAADKSCYVNSSAWTGTVTTDQGHAHALTSHTFRGIFH
jgi:hypothetical protein